MPAHILVAYYSMTGHTRQLADEIRNAVGADLEEIREHRPRHGFSGVVRALFDAVARRMPPILGARHAPEDYELLVIGGPVWAGRMAAPVRTYARRYGSTARRVAFFCTEGGRGAEAAFADLEGLCRMHPAATLVVDAAHLPSIEHAVALGRFTEQVGSS